MESTKVQFLQIIRDYIVEQKSNSTVVNEELCLYANQHQLSPIVYFKTKSPHMQSLYFQAVSSFVNKKRICEDLLETMHRNGVDAFQIKGTVIASYYNQPALRTSGDSDIVVSDLEEAHRIMLENGYDCISQNIGREWQYEKNGFEFEIHDRLVFDEAINENKITNFLNNFWPYVKDGALDINFHFIYILAHLRKHFMNSGVGFRQFLDIAIMEKNCTELDWIWIEHKLEEIGLLTFTQTVLAFIERWWGIKPIIKTVSINSEFYASATDRIFANGVFGFNNPDNDNYLAANEARVGSRMLGALKILFPGYNKLCSEEPFAFLRGKPMLLPFAWVYRMIRGVMRGNVKVKTKIITEKFVSSEYIEKREEMFRQWGLVE